MKRIEQVRKQIIKQIVALQRENGSFASVSTQVGDFSDAVVRNSPFISYLTLQLIGSHLPSSRRRRACEYIRQQRTNLGCYGYWEIGSIESNTEPYPDDLDDTASALTALIECGATLTGEEIGDFVCALTHVESVVGGPYRTWLVPRNSASEWLDVDPVVNANIAFCLGRLDSSLPNLTTYLSDMLSNNTYSSPYYTTQLASLFFLSRVAQLPKDIIGVVKNCNSNTVLAHALQMSILLQSGEAGGLQGHVLALCKADIGNPESFIVESEVYTAGSKALTLAFVHYALGLYVQRFQTNTVHTFTSENGVVVEIHTELERIFTSWPVEFHDLALKMVGTFLASPDGIRIANTPNQFIKHLIRKNELPSGLDIHLGVATVIGWMSYTLLDDLYDGDQKTLDTLPLIVSLQRELTRMYREILPDTDLAQYYSEVMLRIDAAQGWELREARIRKGTYILPNWGTLQGLSDRSFGHALGPIAVLFALGYDRASEEVKKLEQYFTSYLIARQLNDDMHDWQEDLDHGILTAVNTEVLKRSAQSKRQNEEIFWVEVAPKYARRILREVRTAKLMYTDLKIFTGTFDTTELDRLSNAAQLCLRERSKTLAFIQAVVKK